MKRISAALSARRIDAVGNMTARERFRPWVVNPDGSGYLADSEQVTESFTYDGLDRLTGTAAITPHENFKLHMESNLGKKITDPATNWVKSQKLVNKVILGNNNVEAKYKFRGSCYYYFEINPETSVIVDWRFEGSEHDCAIVP